VAAESTRPPEVPLEAGIGPANPPCPVCGEPLFGWAEAPDGAPVRRCEACGLGVAGEAGEQAEALAALDRLRVESEGLDYRIANRASLAAWIGGTGWAPIDAGGGYLFTPESVRRLVAARDQELVRCRWRAGAGVLLMWGTLLNSFTFGRNIALGALGRATATPAGRGWQRGLDGAISVLATPVVLLAALLLESGAGAAGRGGVLELRLRPL
jgi:hypothetical protein